METGKLFVLLLFIINIITCQSQEKKEIPPPDTNSLFKISDFVSTELRVDSFFAHNLDVVLFDINEGMRKLKNDTSPNEYLHFSLKFEKLDSLNYSLGISLYDDPWSIDNIFYKIKHFHYWLEGELPPNIMLEKISKKRFKYNWYIFEEGPYYLCKVGYNIQTGEVKLIEAQPNISW